MGAQGTAVLDFTSTPSQDAQVAVTGQATIVAGSHAEAFWMVESTATNDADDHEQAATLCKLVCSDVVAGTGFTIRARPLHALATGTFNVRWVWN
jgi:hypothetical protein